MCGTLSPHCLRLTLVANGLYDIFFALCMLTDSASSPHELLFRYVGASTRFVAYWVFTYGAVRLYCGFRNDLVLGGATFLIEAVFVQHEYMFGLSGLLETQFVVLFCNLMIMLMWMPRHQRA